MAKGMQQKKEAKKPKKTTTTSTPLVRSDRPVAPVTEVMPKGKEKNKPK